MQRNMLMVIVYLILTVLLVSSSFRVLWSKPTSKDVELKIWFGKGVYLVKEPVILHGSLTNNRDTTIYFWDDDFNSLAIWDTAGKSYSQKIFTKAWTPGPTHSLKPGEIYRFDGDILFTYTMNEGFPVGTYSCYMSLSRYLGEGIKSDTVRFEVKEPIGFEKDAQKMFIEAEKLGSSNKKSDQAFETYQKVIEKYPTSVYVPGALYGSALCYLYSASTEKSKKSVAMYINLIENYPDFLNLSHYFGSIYVIYLNMKDREGEIKTMRELIEKHPNTEISEIAQSWIEKIQKWGFK